MITLVSNDDFSIKMQEHLGKAFIHCRVYYWSSRVCRELMASWEEVKTALKEEGYTEVYTLIPTSDPMVEKFNSKFGFVPLERSSISVLMGQEI